MSDVPQRSPKLAKYRGEYRKDLREKLNAEQAIEEIGALENQLSTGAGTLSAAAVGALKTVLESKWKKVAKILPDLKSVERETGETAEQLAREALNVRLAELHAAAHSRVNGSGSTGIIPAPESGTTTH